MRIAACSSASTCVSLMPARIFCRSATSAMPLLDHEHLIGVELVRDPLRAARAHDDHVLDVVVLLRRLEREHHPLFEQDRKSTRLNSSHSQISYAVFCLT